MLNVLTFTKLPVRKNEEMIYVKIHSENLWL